MRKVTITLDNSYSRIEGLTTEQLRKLKKLLSYTTDPQAAYFSGGWARTKYLIDKHGSFPSGLLSKVTKYCDSSGIKAHYNDVRRIPMIKSRESLAINCPKPHEWQQSAVNSAILKGRGGIVAPTGTGKSLVIALIASRLNVKMLVVVPTIEIKKQLQEALNAYFEDGHNIRIENIDSSKLKTLTDFDCLIIDECHHVAAKTYQDLNKKVWNKIHYRFFLTATFFRNQTNEQLLFEGIAGEVIYKLSYKEAINKGYIVPVEAYYIDLPKQETEAFTYAQVYKELITNNQARNIIISEVLMSFPKCLCLVKEVAHGKALSELSDVPFTNGQEEESRNYIRQFNNGELESIIGTTGILGEGVDTKPAEYIVIAGLGKAKSAFLQQIGRGVRVYPGKESCKIILFRDRSHKYTLRHYNEQCKILKEELGIAPIKLDI